MSTSELGSGSVAPDEPVDSPATPNQLLIAGEVARLASQVLAQWPNLRPQPQLAVPPQPSDGASTFAGGRGVAAPPASMGPSAARPGAAGASASQTAPPTPGLTVAPPLASAPPPKESDLRNIPTLLADGLGSSSPLVLTQPISLPGAPGSEQPYFLDGLRSPADLGTVSRIDSVGPSAARPGAAGASASQTAPPTPGLTVAPPLASAPPPKESDLRNIPTLLADGLGSSSPLVLTQPFSPAGAPGSEQTYFLDGLRSPADLGTVNRIDPGGRVPDASAGSAAPETFGPAVFLDSLPMSLPDSLSSFPATWVATGFPTLLPLTSDFAPPSGSQPASPADGPASSATAPASSPSLSSLQVRPELVALRGATPGMFDAASIKRDFPILNERVHGRPLIWLDNAATTQKPRAVIDRLTHFYEHENSNVHRAAHALAARATDAYEGARDKVRRFLNAPSAQEIVFVRGATEAINLVAQSWGRRNVQAGDEIVITWLEHHANIVPWQQLCAEKGARLCVAPVDARGQVILEEFEKLLGPRTRMVAFAQVSNALGTILPAREMVAMAHRHGARVLVDGAQAVSHMPVDVQALDCDFYCFSGHKIFAPTGIGVLFGKAAVLESMPPWQGGGNMINDVTFEKTTYQPPPLRFEAGTGNIADAVGLGAALDYVDGIGRENISRYEHDLLAYATNELGRVPGLRLIGTAAEKAGVLSFVLDGMRTEDVGAALDREGIAVRSGHHCAQPILRRFGLETSVRASLAPYNTCEDVDALVAALLRLQVGRPRGLPAS